MITAVPDAALESALRPRAVERADTRARVWTLAFAGVLFAAAFFRFHHLGRFGFWVDELNHVYAAQAYNADGTDFVPLKGPYARAFPVTYLTALSFRLFGVSEAAARWPFALVNVLLIAGWFFAMRRFFGPAIALGAAFGLAFCPINISIARECRMYTLFQALYAFGSLAFLTGLEDPLGWGGRGRWRGRFERRWNLHLPSLVAAGVLFYAGKEIHELTLMFGFTAVTWILYRFMAVGAAGGARAALRSKYGLLLGAGALSFSYLVWLHSEFVKLALIHAVKVNAWQAYIGYNHNFYWDLFMSRYPGLMFLLPFGAFYLGKRFGRAGAFMAVSFLPLFLLNSYVFGRKMDRYVIHLFPFFFTLAAAGVAPVVEALWLAGEPLWRRLSKMQRAGAVLALLPAAGLVLYPWATQADDAYKRSRFTDWKSLPADLRADLAKSTVVTTDPREFAYYVGRMPDLYTLSEKSKTFSYPAGLIENAGELRAGLKGRGRAYFIGDRWLFNNPAFFSEGMRAVIRSRFTPVRHGGDPRLLVFRSQ